ncbi:hypothetical protein HanRHA438_Chr16g0775191 [Helianthus annuus]|nr:hypothetical protein HanRHA438_Chr16g0775191 [Helianthus annuus]
MAQARIEPASPLGWTDQFTTRPSSQYVYLYVKYFYHKLKQKKTQNKYLLAKVYGFIVSNLKSF